MRHDHRALRYAADFLRFDDSLVAIAVKGAKYELRWRHLATEYSLPFALLRRVEAQKVALDAILSERQQEIEHPVRLKAEGVKRQAECQFELER